MKNYLPFLLLALLVFSSCRKDKFSYESNWLAPIFTSSLGIQDVENENIDFQNENDSLNLVLSYEHKLDSLLEVLEVPDSLSEASFSLSKLLLEDRIFIDTMPLREMYPASESLDGLTVSLPAQEINSVDAATIDVTETFFKTATFKEAFLDITIHNDLPVDIEVIEFELLNNNDKSTVVSDALYDVGAFSTKSESYNLSGKTVYGVLDAVLKYIKTKQSNGPVLIDADKGLRLELTIRDMKPEKATAIFPAQELIKRDEETVYDFGGPQITLLRAKSGFVRMTVYSTIQEELTLKYSIPQSVNTITGAAINETFVIPAGSKAKPSLINTSFPIDNYEIYFKGKDPNNAPFVNAFHSILTASTEYTGEETSLSLSDSIYIKFGLTDVVPELAIGDFGTKTYTFSEPFQIQAFKEINGDISLENATFDLLLENNFGIASNIEITSIQGKNKRNGKVISLSTPHLNNPFTLERAINNTQYRIPFIKNLSFDKSNSNIKLFMENLPDEIISDIKVITRPYGSNNYTDFIFNDSYMKAVLNIHIPLNLSLDNLSVSKQDTFNLSDHGEIQNIRQGELKLIVSNSFPFSANLKLEFLNDFEETFLEFPQNKTSIIEGGMVNPVNKRVDQPAVSTIIIDINPDQMNLVKMAKAIRVSATFNSPEGERQTIYSDYKIDLKLIADFVYENK